MSVQDGHELYHQHKAGPDNDAVRRADLTSAPGTVAYGRLLYRAGHGDDESHQVVRDWARYGDRMAQAALTNGGGIGLGGGSVPTTDNVDLGNSAA